MAYAWGSGGERSDPVATQANVNIQVVVDSNAHDIARRTRDSPDRLPAGIPSDHVPQKGELAFYSPSAEGRRAPSMPGTPQIVISTVFNGRSIYEDIAFLGVVAAGASDLLEPDASVQIAGLQTIMNTGSHTIHPGQLVGWRFPETADATTGGGGRVAKYHAGQGYSDTRFVPVLFPLDEADIAGNIVKIMSMDPDAAYREYGILRNPIEKSRDPAYRLASNGKYANAPLRDTGGFSVTHLFRDYSRSFAQGFTVPTGSSDAAASALRGDAESAAYASRAVGKEASNLGLVYAMLDYFALMRSRVIGTATSAALPKQQLDILINKRD